MIFHYGKSQVRAEAAIAMGAIGGLVVSVAAIVLGLWVSFDAASYLFLVLLVITGGGVALHLSAVRKDERAPVSHLTSAARLAFYISAALMLAAALAWLIVPIPNGVVRDEAPLLAPRERYELKQDAEIEIMRWQYVLRGLTQLVVFISVMLSILFAVVGRIWERDRTM